MVYSDVEYTHFSDVLFAISISAVLDVHLLQIHIDYCNPGRGALSCDAM
jgi:hypothetical protein